MYIENAFSFISQANRAYIKFIKIKMKQFRTRQFNWSSVSFINVILLLSIVFKFHEISRSFSVRHIYVKRIIIVASWDRVELTVRYKITNSACACNHWWLKLILLANGELGHASWPSCDTFSLLHRTCRIRAIPNKREPFSSITRARARNNNFFPKINYDRLMWRCLLRLR